MSQSHPLSSSEILALAAALAADEPGVPQGNPPDLAELESWRQGKLPAQRAEQVLSHLVRKPELMQQLRQLEQAESELSRFAEQLDAPFPATIASQSTEDQPHWLAHFFRSLTRPVWATALVVMLLAVGILPLLKPISLQAELDALYAEPLTLQTDTWPWRAGLGGKSIDLLSDLVEPATQLEIQAFRHGVRKGLMRMQLSGKGWSGIINQYPAQPPACSATLRDCEIRRDLAIATGYWAIAARIRCLAHRPLPAIEQLFEQLNALPQASALKQQLTQLQAKSQCAQLDQLMDWGLK
jgi:hypothetical protein